jgi:hypothetical protein
MEVQSVTLVEFGALSYNFMCPGPAAIIGGTGTFLRPWEPYVGSGGTCSQNKKMEENLA